MPMRYSRLMDLWWFWHFLPQLSTNLFRKIVKIKKCMGCPYNQSRMITTEMVVETSCVFNSNPLVNKDIIHDKYIKAEFTNTFNEQGTQFSIGEHV